MTRWTLPAAAMVAALVPAGVRAETPVFDAGASGSTHQAVLTPHAPKPWQTVRLTVVQVYVPGVADRYACRMEVRALNLGDSPVSFRTLLRTFTPDKTALDSWLVPSGELAPGQEALRTYSCSPAAEIRVSQDSPYGWPTTCKIKGETASPCPIELHLISSVTLPEPKKKPKKPE